MDVACPAGVSAATAAETNERNNHNSIATTKEAVGEYGWSGGPIVELTPVDSLLPEG